MSGTKKGEKRRPEKKAKPRGEEAAMERKLGGVVPPSLNEVREFVKGQRYVTPVVLAEGFGLKVGVARRLLRELEQQRVVSLVLGDSRMRIYVPTENLVKEAGKLSQPVAARPKPPGRGKRKKGRK